MGSSSSTSFSGNDNCIQGSVTTRHGGGKTSTVTGQVQRGGRVAGGVTISKEVSPSTTISGSLDTGGTTGVKVETHF